MDEVTGLSSTVMLDSKQQRGGKELKPTMRLLNAKGKEVPFANTEIPAVYSLPPGALVNLTDVDMQVLPPWSDAVQYYAAMLCLTKLQNFEQAEYMLKVYSARVPKIIIGAGGTRIPNPYHKTFQRRVSR